VDDAKEYILLFKNLLNKDYEIFTATSGKEALDILGNEDVQVIISDQRMPEMSGEELLENVASMYPDILRFMISGFSDFEAVVNAVNKGKIQAYFHKPIEPEEIKLAINKALELVYLKEQNRVILEELESKNLALKNADRNKTFFLQILSKELNQPLNELRATVQSFKNKPISDDNKNLINLLDNNVSKFEIISSLANQLTLLKTNGGAVNEGTINTTEVLENLFFVVSEKLQKHKVQIELKEVSKNLLFKGDFKLIIRCLENLIDNALQKNSDGGKITLRTGNENKMVFIEVINEGMSCSKENLKSTTDFLSTNKDLLDLNINLELVLAKQIMDAHKGRVECSCKDDIGSFRLFFHSDLT